MRRLTALAFAVLLVLAACGDDDTSGTTAGSTTTTGAASSSTAAPTTTAATTTTTEAMANPQMEMALAAEGTYTGEWNNTTFGSTGSIDVDIAVDEAAGFALITLDLGGGVFGLSDPDPVIWEVDLIAGDLLGTQTDLFGETTGEMDENGHFVLTAPAVPGLGGLALTVEGDWTADGFSGTYTIPDLAVGTFEAIPSN